MKRSHSKRARRTRKKDRSFPTHEELSNRFKELINSGTSKKEEEQEKDERTYFCGFPLREDKINQLWDW